MITETLLYLEGVSVSFDGFKALNNLSLAVRTGEMRAIIGPNGAGKTTMMDVITGKTRPDEGRVSFRDLALTSMDETAIANNGIGRKFQKPTVFESLSVWDNLELAMKSKRAPLASLRWKLSSMQQDKITATLKRINLVETTRRLAGGLSHGQKQWLEIGMLTAKTAELLKDIAKTSAVVVVEHDMDFIRALGVRVTVLHEGSVLAEGNLDSVQNNQRVIDVYLGR
jgi:urea transport system ATP-binding protein